ncbi:hypothetical protein [Niveibacterium terrae]|uniref:hypothetical protein n=1 Tax=Niveibacterium terrae TaxID=3373598 RepID=UPI003A927961
MSARADLLCHPAILSWIAVDLAALALLGWGVAGLTGLASELSTGQAAACAGLGLIGTLVAAIKLVTSALALCQAKRAH